jgi:hypothetical protein
MNEANETYRAASAIAAFDAIQVAFAALVKKGILSKAEAEQILMQAIETIKTGAPAIKPPNCSLSRTQLSFLHKAHSCDRHHIASAAVGANHIHVDGSHVRRVRPYDHPNSAPPRRGFFAAAPLINEVTTLS